MNRMGSLAVTVGFRKPEQQSVWQTEDGDIRISHKWDIIEAAERGLLTDKIMLNTHPQRWDDNPWPWVKEFVGQNVKNVIKRYIIKLRD